VVSGESGEAGRALNAAATAAMEEVLRYALRFKRREEYQPLEELALRVQRAVIEAGAEVLNDDAAERGERGGTSDD
jgi:hypothetical protein